jgi:hypothetical protein
MSRHSHRLAALAAVLAAFSLLPTAGRAQTRTWDQAAVTALAEELFDAVKDLRESLRRSNDPSIDLGQSDSTYRLLDDLRLIRSEARHLADELKKGAGRDQTLPVIKRIEEIRRDAATEARRIRLQQPTPERIAAARGVLEKIEPYYGVAPQVLDEKE